MKKKSEYDKEVTKFFTVISVRDCNKRLKFLVHWKNNLKTTTELSMAPATAPSRAQPTRPSPPSCL